VKIWSVVQDENRTGYYSALVHLFRCIVFQDNRQKITEKHCGLHKTPSQVWQSPSKEEDHYTFRTIPRVHWLIGSVHGTPKLTIK